MRRVTSKARKAELKSANSTNEVTRISSALTSRNWKGNRELTRINAKVSSTHNFRNRKSPAIVESRAEIRLPGRGSNAPRLWRAFTNEPRSTRQDKPLNDEDVKRAKAELRAKVVAELKKMTATERAAASLQACALLEQQAVWRAAKAILFFAPLPDELDIWRLLEDALAGGKTVALPRFDAEQKAYVACQILPGGHAMFKRGGSASGSRGNRAPRIPLNRLDFILVPGVAFDLNGHRLGRGKGYL